MKKNIRSFGRFTATLLIAFVTGSTGCDNLVDHDDVILEREYSSPDDEPLDPETVEDLVFKCLENGEQDVCESEEVDPAGGATKCETEIGPKTENEGTTTLEVTICCGLICDVFACSWPTGEPERVSCNPTTC